MVILCVYSVKKLAGLAYIKDYLILYKTVGIFVLVCGLFCAKDLITYTLCLSYVLKDHLTAGYLILKCSMKLMMKDQLTAEDESLQLPYISQYVW